MENLEQVLKEQYEKILFESYIKEGLSHIFDDVNIEYNIEEIYVHIKENYDVNETSSILELLNILIEESEDPKKKKIEALTKKKETFTDKIDKLKAAKEKTEDSVKKAELNKEIIDNRKEVQKINLNSNKLADKDSTKNKERLKKLEDASKIADELVTIKREIKKYEDQLKNENLVFEEEAKDDTEEKKKLSVKDRLSILKTLAAQKALELKKSMLSKADSEIDKKLDKVGLKLDDKVEKAKSGEEVDSSEGNQKKIDELATQIEALEKQIENSKDAEDEKLSAQKSKSDLISNEEKISGKLKAYLTKKRLEHKIEFSNLILKMVQNAEQKEVITKSLGELEKKNKEIGQKIEKAESQMQDNSDKNATPEQKSKIESITSKTEEIQKADTSMEAQTAEEDKPETKQPEASQVVKNEPEGEKKPESKQPETSQVVKNDDDDEEEKKKGAKESMDEIFKLKDQINEYSPLYYSLLKIEESIKNQDDLWAIKIAINNIKNQL